MGTGLALCSSDMKSSLSAGDFEKSLEAVHALSAEISSLLTQLLQTPSDYTIQQLTAISNSIALHNKIIQSGVLETRKLTQREDVDFNHPKIQRGFGCFLDIVFKVMTEMNLDDASINTFSNILTKELVGFEDKLNTAFKRAPLNMLDRIENPLVKRVLDGESTIIDVDDASITTGQ